MKKPVLLVALAIVMAEGVAYACSCLGTDDPVELRRLADDAARNAVALVEAEAQTSFDDTATGEVMLVRRTVAGQAPMSFKVERGPFPSEASCDVLYKKGERELIILYPSTRPSEGLPVYRTSGLCTSLLLEKPVYRDRLAGRIGQMPGPERG